MTRVAIYGAGNFGYALLKHFDQKADPSIEVAAYDRSDELMSHLMRHRQHLYLHPNVTLSDYVRFSESAASLVRQCDVLMLAVSSEATRTVLQAVRPHLPAGVMILNTAKALDVSTGQRLSTVVDSELRGLSYTYALMAGGTIARDLFEHEPLGVDVASEDEATRSRLKPILESDNLSAYVTGDLLGVEYASAFKNVIAVFAGIVSGLGFSYGSETHVISRIAHAIGAICVDELGADAGTFGIGSQCWGNDMWMSCTGGSRNRELGVLIGRGATVTEAIDRMSSAHKTVEALNTLRVLDRTPLMSVPAVRLLYSLVVEESIDLHQVRSELLSSIYDKV
jgi:glycerol-3-phosphate dehydrogenase (NAD(P)+)